MNDQVDQEVLIKYAKQIGIAIAILLILYGVILILDSLLGMTSVYVSYLWVFYQILVAIVAIFVGIRLYSASRKIRVADLGLIKRGGFILFLMVSLTCIIFSSVLPKPLQYPIDIEKGVIQTKIRVFPSDDEDFFGYFGFDPEKLHSSFHINMDSVDINRVSDKAKERGFTCEFHLDNSVCTFFVPNTIELVAKVSANLQVGVGKWANFCSNATHTIVSWHSLTDRTWLNQTLRTILNASDQELGSLSASTRCLFNREANWTVLKQYLGSFEEAHTITAGMMSEDWSNGHFTYAVDYVSVISKVHVLSGFTTEVINFTSNINVMGWTEVYVNTTYKMDRNSIRNVFKTIFGELDLPTNWLDNVSFEENWRIHAL